MYLLVPVLVPAGPPDTSRRVLRGGSWNNTSNNARSAYRNNNHPANRNNNSGFRLLFTPHVAKPARRNH